MSPLPSRIPATALFLATAVLPAMAAMSGTYTLSSGSATKTDQDYTATASNTSGVYVYGSGSTTSLELLRGSVTTSGASTSTDSSSFFGLNSGVLAYTNGKIEMDSVHVVTTGTGANGVFAYGTGVIDIAGDSVICTGNYAHAIMCSGGGTMTARNLYLRTSGTNSGTVATDRGSGTITIDSSTVIAEGKDSPAFYSTGTITANDCDATSQHEAIVIEGTNAVILNRTTLTGNAGTKNRGIFVMQSQSGDAKGYSSTVLLRDGSYTWGGSEGPAILVTNDSGYVRLVNQVVTNNSPLLAMAASQGYPTTSGDVETWGTKGSNGGHLVLEADSGTTLTGSVTVDSISTFALRLKAGSSLTGHVDSASKGSRVSASLDAASSWTLTADSHVDSLIDPAVDTSGLEVANITGNGYDLYYATASNAALASRVFSLASGGCLKPEGSTATCASTGLAATAATSGSLHLSGGSLAISMPGAASARIRIHDATGRLLLDRVLQVDGGTASLALPTSVRGLLLCEVQARKAGFTTRLVVPR